MITWFISELYDFNSVSRFIVILKLTLKDKESVLIDKEDGSKLIISYKENRAKKDAANRKRDMKKFY